MRDKLQIDWAVDSLGRLGGNQCFRSWKWRNSLTDSRLMMEFSSTLSYSLCLLIRLKKSKQISFLIFLLYTVEWFVTWTLWTVVHWSQEWCYYCWLLCGRNACKGKNLTLNLTFNLYFIIIFFVTRTGDAVYFA